MMPGIEKQFAIVHKFLGRYASLSKKEAEELAIAYREISRMQGSCYHKFVDVTLFTGKQRECADYGFKEQISDQEDDDGPNW